MYNPFTRPYFNLRDYDEALARERIVSNIDLTGLFDAIDADLDIAGAGVVYLTAKQQAIVLREFRPICSIVPKRIILREARPQISPGQFIHEIKHDPRESRLMGEVVNTSLSCVGAIIGWAVVYSGSAAMPFTVGASAWVVRIGVTAALASSVQCLIGGARIYYEIWDPESNDQMDEGWYGTMSPILDAVSLANVGVSAMTTFRLLSANKAATGKSWTELLKGLNRQERSRLTDELLRLKDPALTNKLLKLQQRSGKLVKRYTNTQIRHATLVQLGDALGVGVTLWGSKRAGNLATAEIIAIGLYEEITH